jgi:isopenicillin-N N-acyltransferase-like protein
MHSLHRSLIAIGLNVLLLCSAVLSEPPLPTPEVFRFPAGQHKGGELRIVNHVPVLVVAGTPEEIGEQIGVLAMRTAPRLKEIPRELLKRRQVEHLYPLLMQVGKTMLPRFPENYRREMEAISKSGDVDRDLLTVINTIDDLERIGGCSSITIGTEHSATGGPLMARNLDYYLPDYVPYYTLVTVYRPTGKLAFASVGFPGWLGVLSAMNESGLTLATHQVTQSADHSPSFTPDGTPMTLSFRRVMEECRTVAEAERLLRSVKRTTYLSIAVADTREAAVFELTPQSVVVRRPEDDMLICTNHFRSPELRVNMECDRYEKLKAGGITGKVDAPQLWQRLNKASWGATFQSMIFEPASLKLHLAFGAPPSTAQQPRTLDLAPLMRKRQ